jgi:chorismate mutase
MTLEDVRARIAIIDEEIVELITRRQQLSATIAQIKHKAGIPIHDEEQVRIVLERVFDLAAEKNVDPVGVQKIFEILISMNEERQHDFSGEGNLP